MHSLSAVAARRHISIARGLRWFQRAQPPQGLHWPRQQAKVSIGRVSGRGNGLLLRRAGRQEGVAGAAQAGERIAMDAVTPCYRGE